MSVSSVPSAAGGLQNADPGKLSAIKQRREDFQSLAQALGSGDLAGAQKAFASFQKDMQTIPPGRAGQQGGPSNMKDAIDALGKALSAGDLSGAQKALATLKQDFQNMTQNKTGQAHGRHADSAQFNRTPYANTATSSATLATTINTTA
jgi:hypothetical protein